MKSCAEVPARALSKVITTAPASPVPASNRNLLVSVVSRNCGLFGLKKLRGCGSKVKAKAGLSWARPIRSAAPITARWPRWTPSKLPIATTVPLGIAEAGVVSRITVNSDGILGIPGRFRVDSRLRPGGPDRGLAGWDKSSGANYAAKRVFYGPSREGRLNALFNASMLSVGGGLRIARSGH